MGRRNQPVVEEYDPEAEEAVAPQWTVFQHPKLIPSHLRDGQPAIWQAIVQCGDEQYCIESPDYNAAKLNLAALTGAE